MHILSDRNRSEFLATPQLIRFSYADGLRGSEPTLLTKASTVLLKYIIQGVALRLTFHVVAGRIVYALSVQDDVSSPTVLWSVLETQEEKEALQGLWRGEPLQMFLFNELAVNVAWFAMPLRIASELPDVIEMSATGPADHGSLADDVAAVLDQTYQQPDGGSAVVSVELPNCDEWHAVRSHYVTNQLGGSPIDLFSRDEGVQQEQLAIWLTDNLQPRGAHYSPQVPDGHATRELTDVLLSYDKGAMLIESKTLALLQRNPLPNRARLAKNTAGHVKKAIGQLRGAIRRIQDGTPVTSTAGEAIEVERTQPPHAIVLIPDLDLIADRSAYDVKMIKDFMASTGGFLHLVDVAELLRIVQAAEMIAERSNNITPMMAFDFYLIERAKQALASGTLCVNVLLRFDDS